MYEKKLNYLKEPRLEKVPVLVFANKQDKNDALDPNEIMEKMELHEITNRAWSIHACVATKGDGKHYFNEKF